MQSEDCQECNGTGTAELICGYERPCDACHGKGERPARKDNPMTDELVEQLLGPEGDLCAALCSRAADAITALSAEVERVTVEKAALWALLDDIDTLDDICRGDDAAFRERVRSYQRKRFAIMSGEEFDPLHDSARQALGAKP